LEPELFGIMQAVKEKFPKQQEENALTSILGAKMKESLIKK
jgi:hypothetical protein